MFLQIPSIIVKLCIYSIYYPSKVSPWGRGLPLTSRHDPPPPVTHLREGSGAVVGVFLQLLSLQQELVLHLWREDAERRRVHVHTCQVLVVTCWLSSWRGFPGWRGIPDNKRWIIVSTIPLSGDSNMELVV